MVKTNLKNVYFFVGTTAELIKLAPVIAELKKRRIGYRIIASNQNELRFDQLTAIMGKQTADYTFYMKPFLWLKDIYLRFVLWTIKSVANYFFYFFREFQGRRHDILFIVHGDTVTALIGAIVAKLNRVKLLHIESGLRSFNFFEPFPEEISRFVISWISDIHYSPNAWAVKNLKKHGGKKVNTYGNTIFESIEKTLDRKTKPSLPGLKGKPYFVLVVHRQEHTLFSKDKTKELIERMTGLANENFKCVFIMHKLTKDYLKKQNILRSLQRNSNIILPDRLPYKNFLRLLANAEFLATDGGSNQEEAYYLGLPCLILRNRSERVEGIGENAVLWENRMATLEEFVNNYKKYRRKRQKLVKYPSEIIVNSMLRLNSKTL